MKKRRHHYVWQHYLRAWSSGSQVACIRGSQVFSANTINIAVRTDFYRLKALTSSDLFWVRRLCIDGRAPGLQKVQEGWVNFFTAMFDLRKRHEETVTRDPAVARAFEEAVNNLEEDLHASIEARAIPHLDAIRSGDLSFLLNDDELAAFVHFLAVQSMRTAKMRTKILAAMNRNPLPGFSPENAWGLLSHLFATNVGRSLYANRGHLRSTLLEAPPGAELITSDQPVLNMRAAISTSDPKAPRLGDDDLELYYPISPANSLLIEIGQPTREIKRRRLSHDEVARYNGTMFLLAHEQAFASTERLLQDLSKRAKRADERSSSTGDTDPT